MSKTKENFFPVLSVRFVFAVKTSGDTFLYIGAHFGVRVIISKLKTKVITTANQNTGKDYKSQWKLKLKAAKPQEVRENASDPAAIGQGLKRREFSQSEVKQSL